MSQNQTVNKSLSSQGSPHNSSIDVDEDHRFKTMSLTQHNQLLGGDAVNSLEQDNHDTLMITGGQPVQTTSKQQFMQTNMDKFISVMDDSNQQLGHTQQVFNKNYSQNNHLK